jgi:hypothetical protein
MLKQLSFSLPQIDTSTTVVVTEELSEVVSRSTRLLASRNQAVKGKSGRIHKVLGARQSLVLTYLTQYLLESV